LPISVGRRALRTILAKPPRFLAGSLQGRCRSFSSSAQILAARVLRTLAEAAGRPLADDPVPAGLEVIESAFATVLQWAVAPDWGLRATQTQTG
jgi:hypothetical protein